MFTPPDEWNSGFTQRFDGRVRDITNVEQVALLRLPGSLFIVKYHGLQDAPSDAVRQALIEPFCVICHDWYDQYDGQAMRECQTHSNARFSQHERQEEKRRTRSNL